MIPAYDFNTQQEVLTDPNSYLAATPLSMVRQFMTAMGQDLDQPYLQDSRLDLFRLLLLKEETTEASESTGAENLLKELADVIYVANGYAATFGWDLDEAVRRVHASNMSKLGPDGKPILRDDGKVLKGDQYEEPDLSDLVEPA